MGKAQPTIKLVVLVAAMLCAQAIAQDRQLQVAPSKPAPGGERRIALVIGNSAYKASPLKNPVNDARAISKALAATGFKVTVLEDATLTTMRRAVRAFGDELMSGGVGLFYYAGHGMQVRGRNYLIPVNADIEREDEVEDGALDANFVLAKMESAKNALNLIVLDACRNNPFARSFRSATQGLAQMDAPSGTLVAFATAPGSVASDGDGDNGLYTKHLLSNITRPGLPIEQVFKEVRRGVSRETADRQIPWESSSLQGDFYFIAPDPSLSVEAQKAEMQKAIAEAVKREQDKLAAERAAQQAQMQKMIQDLLAKQRAEMEAELSRQRAEAAKPAPTLDREVVFWDSIKASTNPSDFSAYLAQFPNGTFAALARARLKPAQSESASIEALKPPPVAAPTPALVPTPAPVAAPTPALAPTPPSASVAPSQLASAAPTSMAGFGIEDSRFPRVEDRWEYRYTDVFTKAQRRSTYVVTAVSPDGILETVHAGAAAPSLRAFGPEPQLHYQEIWDFAPYLLSFGSPKSGDRHGSLIPVKTSPECRQVGWSCRFESRVAGTEKVTVPAGTFDALQVVVDIVTSGAFGQAGHIQLTYWYAAEAKRLVKATARTRGSSRLSDYDFELMSYRPAGTGSSAMQVASIATAADSAAGAHGSPRAGDYWQYRYTDAMTGRSVSAMARAATVEEGSVTEIISVRGKEGQRIRYEKDARLVFNGLWLDFSPYLLSAQPPADAATWSGLKAEHYASCIRSHNQCTGRARVVGREKIDTPAGHFDALKIVVDLEIISSNFGNARARREISLWYSESVKRIVKTTSRLTSGSSAEPDYDVELISFTLK